MPPINGPEVTHQFNDRINQLGSVNREAEINKLKLKFVSSNKALEIRDTPSAFSTPPPLSLSLLLSAGKRGVAALVGPWAFNCPPYLVSSPILYTPFEPLNST